MSEKTQNLHKLEGVFSLGYGVVPKSVMLEGELSAEAKALYAYYCVMSGNNGGFQPSPKEALILRSLHMSHTRFIKHRKTLIEQGYLIFSQSRRKEGKQFFETTRYLIVKAPKNAQKQTSSPPSTDEQAASLAQDAPLTALAAVQEGIFSGGYGLVPRLVLFDDALSVEAKAAYVFLCVYANASTCEKRSANPSAALLQEKLMGKKRVQHAMSELIEAGYIRRSRIHNGAFAGFCYTLLFDKREGRFDTTENALQERPFDTAETALQEVNFDTAENQGKSPELPAFSSEETLEEPLCEGFRFNTAELKDIGRKIETAESKTTEIETAKIATARITKGVTNTTQKNIRLIRQNAQEAQDGKTEQGAQGEGSFAQCVSEASMQIEADILSQEYGRDVIRSIVLLLADLYGARSGEMRLNGRSYDVRQVAAVLKEARAEHVESVLGGMKNCGSEKIANMPAYLTACLYNAVIGLGAENYRGGATLF